MTFLCPGVADGVGGWRAYGVDPSLFSKKLMDACEMLVKTGRFVPGRPSELLASGYQELLEDKKPLVGGCLFYAFVPVYKYCVKVH